MRATPLPSRDVYGIQYLRGFAALAVVIHHAFETALHSAAGPQVPDWALITGAAGVDVFFAISGFIMLYVSFPDDRPPLTGGTFLLRRATRIFPLYWLTCLVMLAVSVCLTVPDLSTDPATIATSLALFPHASKLVGLSWTLSYEIYFYLIFAATLFVRSRAATVILTSATIAAFTASSGLVAHGDIQAFLRSPIVFEFCFGLGLAWLVTCYGRRILIHPAWSLVGVAGLVATSLWVPHVTTAGLPDPWRTLAWGLPSALIVWSCLGLAKPSSRLKRFAALLGDASYALYLTHIFVMLVYAALLNGSGLAVAPQYLIIPIVVGLAVALGIGTHLMLEKPLLALIHPPTKGAPRIATRPVYRGASQPVPVRAPPRRR